MSKHLSVLLAVALVASVLSAEASARGFGGASSLFAGGASAFAGGAPAFGGGQAGGFHSSLGQGIQGGDLQSNSYQGGVFGGGFQAGNMKSDSFRVGDFGGGALGQGVRGGDLQSDTYQGGVREDKFRVGDMKSDGFRVGDFGEPSAPAAADAGRLRGLPTDAGLHAASRPILAAPVAAETVARRTAPLSDRAIAARKAFQAEAVFTPAWIADHSEAWHSANMTETVWTAAAWPGINAWFGAAWPENYYNYGNTIVVQGDDVYYQGRPVAAASEYAQAAIDLAASGPKDAELDDHWLPLGVFGALRPGETEMQMVFQLAVNKQGVLRGTYTNLEDNNVKAVHGAVNRQTQRAAWSVGDKPDGVLDTGLYNLTKDESPVLVHFGADHTEQWLLVRIEQDAKEPAGQ
jgi:hypothetical protein